MPQTQYTSGFTVTRVEIEYDFTLTDEELKNAGRLEDWVNFKENYLRYLPNNYKAEKTGEDLAQGTVTVQKTLDLMPKLLNLKDPAVRNELGMTDQDFSDLAQGWRWYTPVLIEWYGVPKQVQTPDNNLAVTITSHPDEAQPGQTVTVAGQITNESDTPITTLVQWYLGSQKVYEGNVTIDKTKDLNFPFTMPDSSTLVTVQVNPGHNQPSDESDWTDNKDSATVKPIIINTPDNDKLTIIARSRAGNDQFGVYQPSVTRPQNTAKWGDDITVTFKAPDAPNSSATYYRLKEWKLVSANVIYPKRNPNFTFGHPLDPVGTITKSMNISGNTATATFNEDWSYRPDAVEEQNYQQQALNERQPARWNAPRGQLISVVGNKGGVGKTTTSATMAVALAQAGVDVAIVDIDLASPNVADFFKIEVKQGIEFLAGRDRGIHIIMDQVLIPAPKYQNIHVLPGPVDKSIPVEAIFQKGELANILNTLLERFQVVIADSPANFRICSWIPEVFQITDLALSVVDQSDFSEQDTARFAPELLVRGIHPQNIRIILNRFSPKLDNAKKVEKAFHAGFKKDVPKNQLPSIIATIPHNWDVHVKHGYKGETVGLNRFHSFRNNNY